MHARSGTQGKPLPPPPLFPPTDQRRLDESREERLCSPVSRSSESENSWLKGEKKKKRKKRGWKTRVTTRYRSIRWRGGEEDLRLKAGFAHASRVNYALRKTVRCEETA